MLSRCAANRSAVVLKQLVKPCAVTSSKNFSVSTQQNNKHPWNKTAWPCYQMYKDLAGQSAGPTLTLGLSAYIISKEVFVLNEEFFLGLVMAGTIYQLSKVVGPPIGKMLDARSKEILDNMNAGKEEQLDALAQSIVTEQEGEVASQVRKEFFEVDKINNEMTLETEYRRRLLEVETEVQKRLDYQLDLERLENGIEERHMAAWVEKEVVSSISADQEEDALNQCIHDLNLLADAKAAA